MPRTSTLNGKFVVEHWRDGDLLDVMGVENAVTTQGKNRLLDVVFGGVPKSPTWYIAFISNDPEPIALDGDQWSNHSGWSILEIDGEENHKAWDESAAADGVMKTQNATQFDFIKDVDIGGIFISDADGSGSGSNIWATSVFFDPLSVKDGDTLLVRYEVDLNAA